MAEKLYFYKSNVKYPVAARFFIGDVDGKALTEADPYIIIEEPKLRDFKRANKLALSEGLIIQTEEPNWEEETPNAITDEKAEEVVKSIFALRKLLAEVTSEAAVRKLLLEAEVQNRKPAIAACKKRLREIVGELPEDLLNVE